MCAFLRFTSVHTRESGVVIRHTHTQSPSDTVQAYPADEGTFVACALSPLQPASTLRFPFRARERTGREPRQ